jgi:hypothetical protein
MINSLFKHDMKNPAAAFALASAAILQNSVMALADQIYWRTAESAHQASIILNGKSGSS